MISLFVKTEMQKAWIKKLYKLEKKFKESAKRIDELAIFPEDNIRDLVDLGYPSITLPEVYGGEGLKVYDMVLLQETIASFDGNTGLSIGLSLWVIGDVF